MTTAARRTGTKGVARPEREQQILEVAGRVFGARGFAATNVADIAREAGISKPLIYNYFGSKEGLFERCLGTASDLLIDEIERTAALGVVGLERALATLDGVFGVLAGRTWVWRVANDPTAPPSASALLGSYRERLEGLAHDGVGELLALAGDDDPLDLAALVAVWSSVFASLVDWWCAHPDVTPEEMSARCERLFAAVFGADAATTLSA
ncbi:TetR/AcrR family transcriptional regulator [Pimelobacter simplex]|uniref:TetR/AcrR family transcriptional regulator n=1 Tax=Nocardioides simplex TaxID=2045 RepID=A0A7J5DUZ2_NOCSI|nr:TetR/AcrR family transcriptional regulator [Pimelobacter simplex]KAB2809144.1 TetR/AcrR family transcriptional regulator [Pimelobacter simplex]